MPKEKIFLFMLHSLNNDWYIIDKKKKSLKFSTNDAHRKIFLIKLTAKNYLIENVSGSMIKEIFQHF